MAHAPKRNFGSPPHRPLWLALLVLLSMVCAPAPAVSEDSGTPAQKTEKEQGRVQAGIELRWRFEVRDNADFGPGDDLERFLGQRIRAHLRFRASPGLSFYVQAQDTTLAGAESDKVIRELGVNLHQAYLDWKPSASRPWELRVGRQELVYGEERLIGPVGWDNVGRSFDAARLSYRAGWGTSDFLAARMVDVRRAGARHRPADQDLYGWYFTRTAAGSAGRTELYSLFLRDGLRSSGEIAGVAPQTARIATLGFRRLWQPKSGWCYSIEHAWQVGERGPDPHRAAMLVGSGGYAWSSRYSPRLGLEYDFATGDNDPRDGRSREFHNLFPTNHLYYGYADLMGLRNMHGFRLTAAARPRPRLTVELDYHHFLLAARRGPWKNAAGRVLGWDRTGSAGRDIGHEVDVTLRFPVRQHLALLGGYSVFVPGAFARRTRGPNLHHFAYVQTSVSF